MGAWCKNSGSGCCALFRQSQYTRRMDTQLPLEDMNAIVSRFQAWAGAQASAQVKHGIRELSYEEAVRTKKRRVAPKKSSLVSTESPQEPPAKIKRSREKKSLKPTKRTSQHSRPNQQPKSIAAVPAFCQVLEKAVAIQTVKLPLPVAIEPRSSVLSLRLSTAEQALFRKRAAEANISVSAYLRQCAMEMEGLRSQIKQLEAVHEVPAIQVVCHSSVWGRLSLYMRGVFGARTAALRLRA